MKDISLKTRSEKYYDAEIPLIPCAKAPLKGFEFFLICLSFKS
jgi:hypothetical protein